MKLRNAPETEKNATRVSPKTDKKGKGTEANGNLRKSSHTPVTAALVIHSWPIAKVIPYARNARVIPQSAIDKVAASIQEFGWQQPIVVDKKGVIVVGHTRLLAAHKLGLAKVPVHVADSLTPAQVKTYRILDNRSNQESTWDMELLIPEILELGDLGIDLGLTGFDPLEIASFVESTEGLTDPDEVPEVPAVPVSQPGDLWILGRHRLLCGDATSKDAVERLMDGESEHAIVTDPPYGVGVDYGLFEDSKENVTKLIHGIVPRILKAPCAVLTTGVPLMWLYPQPAWVMAWIHPAGNGMCSWGFSTMHLILAYGKDPYLAASLGSRPDSLICATDRENCEGHPVAKPMKVWEWLVERVTPYANAIVLDLFGGSGTTLIACEKLGRIARLMELDPAYCDVIVNRWEAFTGNKATREGPPSNRRNKAA